MSTWLAPLGIALVAAAALGTVLTDVAMRLNRWGRRRRNSSTDPAASVDVRLLEETAPPEDIVTSAVSVAVAFESAGLLEEAIRAYDQIIDRYVGDATSTVRNHVARALVNRGSTLAQLGRVEEAIDTFDRCIAIFGTEPNNDPRVREQVVRCYAAKGQSLAQLGRLNEAVLAYEVAAERFSHDPDAAVREQSIVARVANYVTLQELDSKSDSISIVFRVGSINEPLIREREWRPASASRAVRLFLTVALSSILGIAAGWIVLNDRQGTQDVLRIVTLSVSLSIALVLVTLISAIGVVLLARDDVPVRRLERLVRAARSRPVTFRAEPTTTENTVQSQ